MSIQEGLTRRELLSAGVAAGLPLSLASIAQSAEEQPAHRRRGDMPKNIIFMVSDGMSMAVPALAEAFSRQVRGKGTRWYELLQSPEAVHGCFEMYSLTSMVPDSAASSTSWASGSRVVNGSINVLPDGTHLVPIAPLVRGTGRRIGLVTTTMISHATPAGFAAVQPDRDDMEHIAPQYLDLVDVLFGGGREHFDGKLRQDGRDLIGRFTERGYAFYEDRYGLTSARPQAPALGLFGTGHLPFTIDQRNDPEIDRRVPTLAEAARYALAALAAADRGFLLQIEGGRVDHAAHANDAAALLWDQLAFDDALAVALEFVGSSPDTLLIVTTDHGNANPGLTGQGPGYRDSDASFELIAGAKASAGRIGHRLRAATKGDVLSPDAAIEVIRDATGMELSKQEAGAVAGSLRGDNAGEIYRQQSNFVGMLGQALGNHHGIGWTGITHTSDLVISTAIGPGSEKFAGLLRNVDVFERLMALLEVKHRNPSLSPQAARKLQARASASAMAHTGAGAV